VLLRLTPGIDTHTFEAVNTGKVDSKFGFGIETGMAEAAVRTALGLGNVRLAGYHCHVGSQLFDSDVFLRSADVMLRFIADVKAACGYEARELDLGGGYGVRYVESDPVLDLAENIRLVAESFHRTCASLGLAEPAVRLEPGRSIVADAGLTLYRVQSVKRIAGYKNYVAVDGGMADDPRYALYRSAYTVVAADRADEPCDFVCDLAGRCCESGDLLQSGVSLPSGIARGDLVAVLTTGAYNYAMSSNYNRLPRPPVVLLRPDGSEVVAVRGETLADLVRNDG
jgi:diaminopimelate decarboxylase